jgi:DNA (cytosine-5)-methyltransferase 1
MSSMNETSKCAELACDRCKADQQFLRTTEKPTPADNASIIRVVDLFAGCGGMTVGLVEAARRTGARVDVRLAVDSDADVLKVYGANLVGANTRASDVTTLFDRRPGTAPSATETEIAKSVGRCDVLLGGPPCQGHSDLNNHTRRDDPKNALYLVMARAAEVLKPKVVVIENVAPVQWDKSGVVSKTKAALDAVGYRTDGRVIDLRRVGVPQRRRRYLLIASRLRTIVPSAILDALEVAMADHPDRTVDWAVRDLEDVSGETTFDTASKTSPKNAKRIAYLFAKPDRVDLPNSQRPKCHKDKEHSYNSMYGRLSWNKPAQTITTGFGSMGQGRYVHPSKPRTITPHEAARLQTFPDWYDFGTDTRRGVLAKVIGNAVPPLLMVDLGASLVPLLVAEKTAKKHSTSTTNAPTTNKRSPRARRSTRASAR